jgi:hypothetical protein
MKSINSSFLLLLSTLVASGQNANQIQNRSESASRPQPAPLNASSKNSKSDQSFSKTDSGAQRPVSLKNKGISTYFGYDSKYFYRSNPTATTTDIPTGMWTNTFYAGSGLGVYDMDSAVITPYIGASWTINDYAEGELGQLNYNRTHAYALLLAQYGNGWSVRVGFDYIMDKSTEYDTEDYRDYSPNIGVMKAYSLSSDTTGIFDASISSHDTESFIVPIPNDSSGKMDGIEYAVAYGLNHTYGDFIISPKYKLGYKTFDTGLNNGRDDLTHVLSLKIDYPVSESFKLSAITGFTSRDSSGGNHGQNYDYESYDAGAGLGLKARF